MKLKMIDASLKAGDAAMWSQMAWEQVRFAPALMDLMRSKQDRRQAALSILSASVLGESLRHVKFKLGDTLLVERVSAQELRPSSALLVFRPPIGEALP